jgi:hypothetical protein
VADGEMSLAEFFADEFRCTLAESTYRIRIVCRSAAFGID